MPSIMPEKRSAKKAKFLALYAQTFNVAKASEGAGIHRSTAFRWRKSDLKFATSLHDVEESMLDEAESKLMELVRSGNLQAVKFLLRTKGRSRGYGDRLEIAQTVKQVDTKRLELLLSDNRTRQALEILALKSLESKPDEVTDGRQITNRNTECTG